MPVALKTLALPTAGALVQCRKGKRIRITSVVADISGQAVTTGDAFTVEFHTGGLNGPTVAVMTTGFLTAAANRVTFAIGLQVVAPQIQDMDQTTGVCTYLPMQNVVAPLPLIEFEEDVSVVCFGEDQTILAAAGLITYVEIDND